MLKDILRGILRGIVLQSQFIKRKRNSNRLTIHYESVIDIITINTIKKTIVNKNHFYQLPEESFNEKNDIDKKKKEIEVLQEKIKELHAKFKKYENIDNDFSREIHKAYKEKLKPLYSKKVALENTINTFTTISDYLYQFKKTLAPYNKLITSLDNVPLHQISSRVIIHDKDHITFVFGNADDISVIKNMGDDILVQEEIYNIRKTKHKLRYGIYIN